MIHLCYSNRTEELLAALSRTLADRREDPGASIFEATHLVVPNRNVETYVKLGLARALGIAANIETRLLRGFLSQVLRDSVAGAEIIDRPHIQGELLALFHDARFLVANELAPVRAYLEAGGLSDDAMDLRRCQLSGELAALFDDYAFSRPEMLAAWRDGKLIEGPDVETQRWQRTLWSGIFGPTGTLAARDAVDRKQRRTMADLFERLQPSALRLPPAVHVFGISYVARLYKSIFAALAQSTALHIYTLNPCREFWEDLETTARRPRAAERRKFPPRRSHEQLLLGEGLAFSDAVAANADGETTDENPLLASWGRPGRDNIKLLNQLSDCDFEGRFFDPLTAGAGTILQHLQHDILDRVPSRQGQTRLSLEDDSVTVMACPDTRRELETIAAEIWRLVRRDHERRAAGEGHGPPLRFSDVAVILAAAGGKEDVGARLTLASGVFREASDLPHAVVDLPLGAESHVLEALELLLALPLGPLGRQDLLRLAMCPAVSRRFPGVDPADWLHLTEELGVVAGADRDDQRGTYLERDLHNWDQGLKRLALGLFLTGRRGGDDRVFQLGTDGYLAAELPGDARSSALRFASVVRSLLADARQARDTRQTLRAWMGFLRAAISRTIRPEDPEEQSVLARCLAELAPLEELGPPDLTVGYRVACELVRGALGALAGRRGQYLADGVTLSSFLPMRAIPFRVIFIAGLGEGEFPSTDRKRPLDLRAGTRRPGDVSAREQDQYMFLEALLCARERLYCSYVARDPLTGEKRAPSSTLADLADTLAGGYLAPGANGESRAVLRTRQPPLRRHEDPDVRALFPAAAREHQAAALGAHLRAGAAGGVADQQAGFAALRRTLPADVWSKVAAALGWVAPPRDAAATAANGVEQVVITTAQIRRFLECPLQGGAELLLGLRDADEAAEIANREDESFDSPRWRELPLLRDVFLTALATGKGPDDRELAAVYERAAQLGVLDGTLPTGPFGDVVRERHRAILGAWRAALLGAIGQLPSAVRLWIGHAAEHHAHEPVVPAVTLDLPRVTSPVPGAEPRRVRVAIHGRSEALAEVGGERLALLLSLSPRSDNTRDERELLRAWIDHVVLSATGQTGGQGVRALICRADSRRDALPSQVTFLPMKDVEARAYLETVVTEMLAGVHPYLLPWEAVMSARRNDSRPVPDVVAMLRDDNFTKFRSDYGPVPDPRSYPPPPDDVARALIERRFGPFFSRRRDSAGEGSGA